MVGKEQGDKIGTAHRAGALEMSVGACLQQSPPPLPSGCALRVQAGVKEGRAHRTKRILVIFQLYPTLPAPYLMAETSVAQICIPTSVVAELSPILALLGIPQGSSPPPLPPSQALLWLFPLLCSQRAGHLWAGASIGTAVHKPAENLGRPSGPQLQAFSLGFSGTYKRSGLCLPGAWGR